jgi:TolB-like protein
VSVAVACAVLTSSAGAQTGKPTVAVLPASVTTSSTEDHYLARAFEGALVQGLGRLGRVTVLDRTQSEQVGTERRTQRSEESFDSKVLAEQGRKLGAQLVVTANVDKVVVTTKKFDDGSLYYEANMSVTARMIDVSTEEVKVSSTIEANSQSGGKGGFGAILKDMMTTHRNTEDALTATVKNSSRDVDKFMQRAFPVRYMIAQVESMAPDSSSATFLVDGGKNVGVRPKAELAVIELSEIKLGGRTVTREKELGKLEITKLDGEELSIGGMKGGAREVARLLSQGKKIFATVRQ